jgi:carboxyl-terminal processing protease
VGQRLLRGAPGSVVKLTLMRAGTDPIELSLVRERLALLPARGKVLEGGQGYLRVQDITPRTAEEVRTELDGLRRAGARSVVLDLRGAAFGAPADGVKIAELFVKGGVVAKLAGSTVPEQVFTGDPAHVSWELPMAALIDNGTAGAAEIVAAALLDAGRSPLVGERTFGRTALQKAMPLAEGGLVITVARYLSPKGTAIHGHGVAPSVPVDGGADDDSSLEDQPTGPRPDPILEKALEVLSQPAPQKKAA